MRKLVVTLAAFLPLAVATTARADDSFTVAAAPIAAKKGQAAKGSVVVKPGKGFHINQEYPLSLKLLPVAGVSFAKQTLTRSDAHLTEQEGAFEVEVTAADAGKKTLTGELKFAVCSATTCDPKKVMVNLPVEVK